MSARRATRIVRGTGLIAAVAVTALTAAGCVAAAPAPDSSGAASDVPYSDVEGLPEAAIEVMNQPQFATGRWLISVEDLETGETLIDLDGDKLAEPGSFVKTYSAGAAWLKWGPEHTITTPVKQSGDVKNGVLDGDLVLVGKGDITMGGRTKADGTVDFTNMDHNDANPLPGATLTTEDPFAGLDDLAQQVANSGITEVGGDVVVDDRLFDGELAEKPVTPIVINQNLIDILITPGEVGEPAEAELAVAVAPWKLDNRVETVAEGEEAGIRVLPIDPETPRTIVIVGAITVDSDPDLKVFEFDDPATFARTAFIEALERAGVTVTADPVKDNPEDELPSEAAVDTLPSVAELESLPLSEEATYVMKISYNRGAQTLICRLAAEAGSKDCDAGMVAAKDIWADAGLDTLNAVLVDGSGLEGNLITPQNAVDVQSIMAKRPDAELWKATMPVLGVDGSLYTVQTDSPAAGKVFAKTGTLVGSDTFNGRVRVATKTLGGVMDTAGGRHLAFTIIMNQGLYDTPQGIFDANDDVGAVAASIQQAF